jgi:hypothetical protein
MEVSVKSLAAAVGLIVLVSGAAFAQSPYAGMQQRPIKALSEQQIADLKAGRGMGLALAAELNGYPGPAHLLQLADKLALSGAQRDRINQLFDDMLAEALPIGAKLIEQETALDEKFAARTITPDDLKVMTAQIGATQAELRTTHLKYHLKTPQILSAQQTRQYVILRGYALDMPMQHHHAK